MSKELDPITPPSSNIWFPILASLADHPTDIQPVILLDPATGIKVGTFNASSVIEDTRPYLMIENVSKELNEVFVEKGKDFDMQKFADGIYLIPISSPIFGI